MALQHLIKDIDTVSYVTEGKLINYTGKENNKKRFGIGKPVEKDEYLHTFIIHKTISEGSCITRNFVDKVIKEGTEKCKDIYTKEKIKTVYVKIPGTNDVTNMYDVNCVSKIEW